MSEIPVPPRARAIIEGLEAVISIIGVEYKKRKEKNMGKKNHDDDDDDIESELPPLPKDVLPKIGMENNRMTIGMYDGKKKIVQFALSKAEAEAMIKDMTKVHGILEDEAK